MLFKVQKLQREAVATASERWMKVEMQVCCPECKHKFAIELQSSRELDDFGYEIGSKGSFIANEIKSNPSITVKLLRQKCLDKYGVDSIARIRRVIFELKKKGHVKTARTQTVVKFQTDKAGK